MNELLPAASVPPPHHLLDSGEQPIWWDKPRPMNYARAKLGFNIPFFVFFTGFAAFWMYKASEAGGIFWMFGLLFFGAGLWGLSEPVRRYLAAPRVQYLLTDRRAVIATDRSVKSVALSRIEFVELNRVEGGVGDVLFITEQAKDGEGGTITNRDGFVGIADAQKVERELRRLQQLALS